MSGRPHAKPTVGSGAPAQINEAAGTSNTNGRGRVRDRIPPVQLDMSPVLPSSAKEADGDGWARAQEELNGLNEMMKRQMELIMVCESYYIFIVFFLEMSLLAVCKFSVGLVPSALVQVCPFPPALESPISLVFMSSPLCFPVRSNCNIHSSAEGRGACECNCRPDPQTQGRRGAA